MYYCCEAEPCITVVKMGRVYYCCEVELGIIVVKLAVCIVIVKLSLVVSWL